MVMEVQVTYSVEPLMRMTLPRFAGRYDNGGLRMFIMWLAFRNSSPIGSLIPNKGHPDHE